MAGARDTACFERLVDAETHFGMHERGHWDSEVGADITPRIVLAKAPVPLGVGPGQLLLEFLGHRHDRRTCQSAEGAPEGRGWKNPEATYPATCLDNPAPRVNFTPPRGAH